MSKAKNIIIFLIIVGGLFLLWNMFANKKEAEDGALVSRTVDPALAGEGGTDVGSEFLTVLLNLRTIKLDQTIFERQSFQELYDYTRVIPPPDNVGRPNPFAPIGTDILASPAAATPATTPTATPASSQSGATSSPSTSTATTTKAAAAETKEATSVTRNSALLNGALLKAAPTTLRYFEYGLSEANLATGTPMVSQKVAAPYSRVISDLQPGTTYYFRAVAVTGTERSEGDVLVFTTLP